MTVPAGLNVDQYKTQAKDLLKDARAGDPEARRRFQRAHPEGDARLTSGNVLLSDSQLVIAREQGYGSWAKHEGHADVVAVLEQYQQSQSHSPAAYEANGSQRS